MNLEKHAELFNRIAFVYSWFFKSQFKSYSKILNEHLPALGLTKGDMGLDIGCGTGAFTYTFERFGFNMSGIDISKSMIKQAGKAGLECLYGNAADKIPYHDDEFDFVVCAYVAHGLEKALRIKLFSEAKRVAKKFVLFHDYNARRKLLTDIVEWAEGGDYFNFIKSGLDDMREVFKTVQVIDVAPQNAWYICRK